MKEVDESSCNKCLQCSRQCWGLSKLDLRTHDGIGVVLPNNSTQSEHDDSHFTVEVKVEQM